jgi:hypothetical protein
MVHMTLNSGKTHHNRTPIMLANLERLVQPFLANGGGPFPSPYDAYRIETEIEKTGVAFYFFSGDENISVSSGTWSSSHAYEYWKQIEKEYYDLTDICPMASWTPHPPKMPDSVPWLATLLLPGFFLKLKSDSEDIQFLNTCEFVFFEVAQKLNNA